MPIASDLERRTAEYLGRLFELVAPRQLLATWVLPHSRAGVHERRVAMDDLYEDLQRLFDAGFFRARFRNIVDYDEFYRLLVTRVIPRVEQAARAWMAETLERQRRQLPDLGRRLFDDAIAARIHEAAQKADAAYRGAAGAMALPVEPLWPPGEPIPPKMVAALTRNRMARAVNAANDPDLSWIFAHPAGVVLVQQFADSVDAGRSAVAPLLISSTRAAAALADDLERNRAQPWHFKAAVGGGVIKLGLAAVPGFNDFALAWAHVQTLTRIERALVEIADALFLLELAGPHGAVAAEVLEAVISAAQLGFAFLRDLEQDRAGTASAFDLPHRRLAGSSGYAQTQIAVVALLASIMGPVGITQLGKRASSRVASKKLLTTAQPRSAVDTRAMLSTPPSGARGVTTRGIIEPTSHPRADLPSGSRRTRTQSAAASTADLQASTPRSWTKRGIEFDDSGRRPTGRRETTLEEQRFGIPDPKRWRQGSPGSAQRAGAQRSLPKGSPDPALPGEVLTEAAQPDHIVTAKAVSKRPGYARLSAKRQQQVLNTSENLWPVSRPVNHARRDTPYWSWNGVLPDGRKADPGWLATMRAKEAEALPAIDRRIQELLKEQAEERWKNRLTSPIPDGAE